MRHLMFYWEFSSLWPQRGRAPRRKIIRGARNTPAQAAGRNELRIRQLRPVHADLQGMGASACKTRNTFRLLRVRCVATEPSEADAIFSLSADPISDFAWCPQWPGVRRAFRFRPSAGRPRRLQHRRASV